MKDKNALGQPIGPAVPNWAGRDPVPHRPMSGIYCDVVPLSATHGDDLFTAYQADSAGKMWTYLPIGPFPTRAGFDAWLRQCCASRDPLFFAIIDKPTGQALGVASFLRMQPENGVAEVGYITFSPALQRTRASTEAMYLMMRRILGELNYRRYEWKCDALNAASRAAATRLGFTFEGTFRQAIVYKGRNRDTAWFSLLDCEWPAREVAFKRWLAPDNFDPEGTQKRKLQASG